MQRVGARLQLRMRTRRGLELQSVGQGKGREETLGREKEKREQSGKW